MVPEPEHRAALHSAKASLTRFNKTYREEELSAYGFASLDPVREITESWLLEYNLERPHDSLGSVPPLIDMPRQAHRPLTVPVSFAHGTEMSS